MNAYLPPVLPPVVIYVGLGLCLLFLLIASLQQKCSAKVFFILALRLAIGWHFLFEGLYKIQSHYVGPTDSNKPFSSEMYFVAADGPLGPLVRERIGDPAKLIQSRVVAKSTPSNPKSLSDADYVKLVPDAVAADWNLYVSKFLEEYPKADDGKVKTELSDKILANYGRWIVGAEPGKDSKIRYVQTDVAYSVPNRLSHIAKLETAMQELKDRIKPGLGQGYGYDQKHITASKTELTTARAELLADADAVLMDMKKELFAKTIGKQFAEMPSISNQLLDEKTFTELMTFTPPAGTPSFDSSLPPVVKNTYSNYLTAVLSDYPLKVVKKYPLDEDEKKKVTDMADYWKDATAKWFTGEGFKKLKTAFDAATKGGKKDEIEKAKVSILTELDKQFNSYKNGIMNMLPAEMTTGTVTIPVVKPIEQMDKFTMYFIAIVGGCIFLGIFTRLSCVLAVGFLAMTYLTHPPFPWLPLPPNTEGNPLFINKNVIEALALLVIAVHPTGRWLGLDALIQRVLFGRKAFVEN